MVEIKPFSLLAEILQTSMSPEALADLLPSPQLDPSSDLESQLRSLDKGEVEALVKEASVALEAPSLHKAWTQREGASWRLVIEGDTFVLDGDAPRPLGPRDKLKAQSHAALYKIASTPFAIQGDGSLRPEAEGPKEELFARAKEVGAALDLTLGAQVVATLSLSLQWQQAPLTITIYGRDDGALALDWPWECLGLRGSLPGMSGELRVERALNVAQGESDSERPPLRIGALIAAPKGALRGRQEEAGEALWRALAKQRDHLLLRSSGREADLLSLIKGWGAEVLYLRGCSQGAEILLEGEDSRSAPLSEEAIAAMAGEGGPSLVVLDIDGLLGGQALSWCRRLTDLGVPATCSIAGVSNDGLKLEALSRLLDSLGSQDSLAEAMVQAHSSLQKGNRNTLFCNGSLVMPWVGRLGGGELRFGPDTPPSLRAWEPGETQHAHTSADVPPPPWGVVSRRGLLSRGVDAALAGERIFKVMGPPGVGKTTFLSTLIPALQGSLGDVPALILQGSGPGEGGSDLASLWAQVQSQQVGAAWDGVLGSHQVGGLKGEGLAEVVLHLSREIGGLLIVLDDACELQRSPGEGETRAFRDPEVEAFLQMLRASTGPRVGLVVCSRYGVGKEWGGLELPLLPMGPLEQLGLLRRFSPLNKERSGDVVRVASRLDGRPASAVLLGALIGAHNDEGGEGALWRASGPVSLEALFSMAWARLGEADQALLGALSALNEGVPWEGLASLGATSGAGSRLASLGLMIPVAGWGTTWGVPSWARELALQTWGGDVQGAHLAIGAYYASRFTSEPHPEWDRLATRHLSMGGDWSGAADPARRLVLDLRAAGRYAEALDILESLPPAPRRGDGRVGLMTVFRCQIARLSGVPGSGAVEELRRAVGQVSSADRSFALDELGQHLMGLSRFDEAVATLEQSVSIERADKGPRHPDVAASLRALARAFEAKGDMESAQKALEEAISGGGQSLEEGDEQRAEALVELSRIQSLQGDLDGARERLKQSIEMKRKALGADASPQITRSLQELAGVDMALGRQDEALAKFNQAVEIEIEAAGSPSHPNVIRALGELVRVARMLGKTQVARSALDRQISALEEAHGVADLSLIAPLQERAEVKAESGNMAGTAGDLQRSLTILKRMGGSPEATAGTLTQLAGVVQSLGDASACMAYLDEAFALRQSIGNDPLGEEMMTLRTLIGGSAKAMGDVARAKETFSALIKDQATRHGTAHHLDVAVAETNLAQILLEEGKEAEAGPHIEHAYGVFLDKAGPTHPVTIQLARLVPGSEEGLLSRNDTAPYVKRTFAFLKTLRVTPKRLGRLAWRLMLRENAGPFLPMLLLADLECLTPGTLAESPSQVPPPTKAPQQIQLMWSGLIMELAQAHARFRYDFDALLSHLPRDGEGRVLPTVGLTPKAGEGHKLGDGQALVDEARAIIVAAERGSEAGDLTRDRDLVVLGAVLAMVEDQGEGGAEMAQRLLDALPDERDSLLEIWAPAMSDAHRRALGVTLHQA